MTPREAVGLTLGVVVVIGLWTTNAKRQGALAEKLRVADSVSVAAVKAHKAVSDSALHARLEAANLRDAARREVRRDAIAEQRTDSTLRASAGERERSAALLADSAATLGQLRGTLALLVQASRVDSQSFAAERLQHARSILALGVALAQDSVTIESGRRAELAAINRSLAAETQVRLLRSARPSAVGNILRTAGWAGAGFVIGRAMR